MGLFDEYNLRARIAPPVLVLLPLAAAVFPWAPSLDTFWLIGLCAVAGIGALAALANEARRDGANIQGKLFQEWGGTPTTQLLRHRDTNISHQEKLRYHCALQARIPNLHMPSPSEELESPTEADSTYENAIAWLREQTREKSKFPLVFEENTNYGYFRNMFALRVHALVAAGVGATASLLAIATTPDPWKAYLSLCVSVGCGIVVCIVIDKNNLRKAAFAYALTLVRAIDGLPHQK